MARYEEPQEIPSELFDKWRHTMGWAGGQPWQKKRHPFKIPPMQEGGRNVRPSQIAQRVRFKTAIALFKPLSQTERQRWYDAAPEWNSFLWYYNYFIMSALVGNANVSQGGAGVIKSIQNVIVSIGSGTSVGEASISEINPDKAVIMLQGNSGAVYETETAAAWLLVFPIVDELQKEKVKLKWGLPSPLSINVIAANVSATIIEYI